MLRRAVLLVGLAAGLLLGTAPSVVATQEPDNAEEPDATTAALLGTLLDGDRAPIEGVEITVTDGSGEAVGEAISAEDGTWRVEVPGAGDYSVTVVVESLPDGVALRDPDRSTLTITVRDGQERTAIFPFGQRQRRLERSDAERLLSLGVDGIRFGLIIALASVGLSLIYGVTRLTNFAHGDLVTFGAMVAWALSTLSSGPELALPIAAIGAVIAGGVFGLAQEVAIFAPLRRRRAGTVSLIVVTIGMGLVLRNAFLVIFGGEPRNFGEYAVQRAFDVGPVSLRPKDYAVVVVAAVVLLGYGWLLRRTRLGTGVRAVADNRDLAEASGIDVGGVIRMVWVLGGALAALGGVLLGLSEQVAADMGSTLLLLMFAAVVLGGIGTAYGALVGGLLIGVVCQMSTFWIDSRYRIGVGLAVLVVVVLLRPQGILGQRQRVG